MGDVKAHDEKAAQEVLLRVDINWFPRLSSPRVVSLAKAHDGVFSRMHVVRI